MSASEKSVNPQVLSWLQWDCSEMWGLGAVLPGGSFWYFTLNLELYLGHCVTCLFSVYWWGR